MLEQVKNKLIVSKKKAVAFAVTFCLAFTVCSAAFAETTGVGTVDLSNIGTAVQSAMTNMVTTGIALIVGIIPVALQIMSAFGLYKLGRKFFGQLTAG